MYVQKNCFLANEYFVINSIFIPRRMPMDSCILKKKNNICKITNFSYNL